MKISYFTTRLTEKDAQGNFIAAIIGKLAEKHDVALYTFANERADIKVPTTYLGGANKHSLGANIKCIARRREIASDIMGSDLIVMAGPDFGAIFPLDIVERNNSNVKFIYEYHGLTPPEYQSLKDRLLTTIRKPFYHAAMKSSDLVITDSQYMITELKDEGITARHCYMGVPSMSGGDRKKIRTKYGIGDDELLALYVGRLAPHKDVASLVRAAEKMERTKLLVVGDGPERENLKMIGNDNTRLAGRVGDEELRDCYAACDYFVTASKHEGFCVPIIEAYSAGKPVVVPARCSMTELVGHAGIAYTHSVAWSMHILETQPQLYAMYADSARRLAPDFTLDKAVERRIRMMEAACSS